MKKQSKRKVSTNTNTNNTSEANSTVTASTTSQSLLYQSNSYDSKESQKTQSKSNKTTNNMNHRNRNSDQNNKKWTIVSTPQNTSFRPTLAVILWLGAFTFIIGLILYRLCYATLFRRFDLLLLLVLGMHLPRDPIQIPYGDMWIVLKNTVVSFFTCGVLDIEDGTGNANANAFASANGTTNTNGYGAIDENTEITSFEASSSSSFYGSLPTSAQETKDESTFVHSVIMLASLYAVLLLSIFTQSYICALMALSLILPHDVFQDQVWARRFAGWVFEGAAQYFGLVTILEDEESIRNIQEMGGLQSSRGSSGSGGSSSSSGGGGGASGGYGRGPNANANGSSVAAIVAMEPHHIFAYGGFAFHSSLKRIPGTIGHTMKALGSSAMFNTPFLRQLFPILSLEPIQKSHFRQRLRLGQSCVICPGGTSEVLYLPNPPNGIPRMNLPSFDVSNCKNLDVKRNESSATIVTDGAVVHDVEQQLYDEEGEDIILYLKNHKGFIKLALESGSCIIPAFCFNYEGSYGYYIPPGCSERHHYTDGEHTPGVLSKFVSKVRGAMGYIPVFFWGRWKIPYFIPHPNNIRVVVGKPIIVPQHNIDNSAESSTRTIQHSNGGKTVSFKDLHRPGMLEHTKSMSFAARSSRPRLGQKMNSRRFRLGEKNKDVPQHLIDLYHSIYLQELEALYERHKHYHGYGNRRLVIM